jgi:hypothetical protein
MSPDIALPPPPPRSNWFTKFGECLFTFVAFVDLTIPLSQLLPRALLLQMRYFVPIIVLLLALSIPIALVCSIWWHSKEKARSVPGVPRALTRSEGPYAVTRSETLHARALGIIRYWLAFMISLYGFGKILRTQFAPQLSRDDIPVGRLSGFQLTWNYFGHSYTFAVILGLLQIGGAILLLFRRTTLLGAVVLLPVLVNIVLINLFYNIDSGAFMNSILFTLALCFLLYLRRQELIALFLRRDPGPEPVRLSWLKNLLRLLVVGGAFGFLYYFVRNLHHSPLEGKWNVDSLVRNRDTVKGDAWLTNSGDWRTVYIEYRGGFSLCPNPYIYEPSRSLEARYKYDTGQRRLQLFFDKAVLGYADTVSMAVSYYDGKHMDWNGIMGKDTLFFALTRR